MEEKMKVGISSSYKKNRKTIVFANKVDATFVNFHCGNDSDYEKKPTMMME